MIYVLLLCIFTVCFKIFDTDHDGKLGEQELREMIDSLVAIRMENKDSEQLVNKLLNE
jgi:Ca2+-binding EF-hand superfamily protein